MKKMLSFVMVLACILTLSGCDKEPSKDPSDEKGQTYFNATFLELNDDSVKVECTQSFNSGISVGEEVCVSTDVEATSGAPELAIGDDIRIVFNGDVMESYPLQIGTVFAVYFLDENGEVIPND